MERLRCSRSPLAAVAVLAAVALQTPALAGSASPDAETTASTAAGPGIDFGNAPPLRLPATQIGLSQAAPDQAPPAPADGVWPRPATHRGYVGLGLATVRFRPACCSGQAVSGYLYAGGAWTDGLDVEIGYADTGVADLAAGSARARGLNLSLVLRMGFGRVNAFVKAGALYGRTEVSQDARADIDAGTASGWGSQGGVGIGYDFAPSSGVVVEWSRSRFRFPGGEGRSDVDSTRLGYVHRL